MFDRVLILKTSLKILNECDDNSTENQSSHDHDFIIGTSPALSTRIITEQTLSRAQVYSL